MSPFMMCRDVDAASELHTNAQININNWVAVKVVAVWKIIPANTDAKTLSRYDANMKGRRAHIFAVKEFSAKTFLGGGWFLLAEKCQISQILPAVRWLLLYSIQFRRGVTTVSRRMCYFDVVVVGVLPSLLCAT